MRSFIVFEVHLRIDEDEVQYGHMRQNDYRWEVRQLGKCPIATMGKGRST